MSREVINFSAGPSCLPEEVLRTAQSEFLDWHGCGRSVCEVSHRGKEFTQIIEQTKADIKKVMNVPDDYVILFLVGGGTAQFAAVPMNFASPDTPADYIVSGSWSKQAAEDARPHCKVNIVATSEDSKFTTIPDRSTWKFSPDAAYVHYCDNETIYGVEFQDVPEVPAGVPLVCDMSSNLMSRYVDVSKFGMIYGGTQKNSGIAGVTIAIIRKDLLARSRPTLPSIMNYKKKAEHNSLDNTPPTFSIYMAGLVTRWIVDQGGIEEMFRRRQDKAKRVYAAIDSSNGFYTCPTERSVRSMVNIPIRIKGGDDKTEEAFLKEAEAAKMVELKGHRSVGGLRVSLYNAMSDEGVDRLVKFMDSFQKDHS